MIIKHKNQKVKYFMSANQGLQQAKKTKYLTCSIIQTKVAHTSQKAIKNLCTCGLLPPKNGLNEAFWF